MHIVQIEVGKDYYGYDCIDNWAFRLIRYHVIEKATWSLKASRFIVNKYGDTALAAPWSGYPDSLYPTPEKALQGLRETVEKFIDIKKEEIEKPAPYLVNAVTVYACCETCAHLLPESHFCTAFNSYVGALFDICKEGRYSCKSKTITDFVRAKQGNSNVK